MPAQSGKDDVRSSMNKLTISPSSAKPTVKSNSSVADSWEDEDVSDEEPQTPKTPQVGTAAPPPTPINATYSHQSTPSYGSSRSGDDSPADRRPEKTDAVARRMIAAGLGLKAPKQTEEQKAYQRSIREQEKKKREQEKADEARRQEEVVKAKAAIWED
jgi:hypothetical protein